MTTENRRDLKLARVGEVGTESNGLGSGLDLERLLLGKTNLLSDLVRKFLVDGGAEKEKGKRVRSVLCINKVEELETHKQDKTRFLTSSDLHPPR